MSSLSAGRGKIVVESDSLSVKSSMSVAYSDICNGVEKLDFDTVLKSSMRSEHGVDGDMPTSCSADTIRLAVLSAIRHKVMDAHVGDDALKVANHCDVRNVLDVGVPLVAAESVGDLSKTTEETGCHPLAVENAGFPIPAIEVTGRHSPIGKTGRLSSRIVFTDRGGLGTITYSDVVKLNETADVIQSPPRKATLHKGKVASNSYRGACGGKERLFLCKPTL